VVCQRCILVSVFASIHNILERIPLFAVILARVYLFAKVLLQILPDNSRFAFHQQKAATVLRSLVSWVCWILDFHLPGTFIRSGRIRYCNCVFVHSRNQRIPCRFVSGSLAAPSVSRNLLWRFFGFAGWKLRGFVQLVLFPCCWRSLCDCRCVPFLAVRRHSIQCEIKATHPEG
jgi:hypothetical protein